MRSTSLVNRSDIDVAERSNNRRGGSVTVTLYRERLLLQWRLSKTPSHPIETATVLS